MVNHFVGVLLSQSIIGRQRIGVERRASFDVLFDDGVKRRPLAVC